MNYYYANGVPYQYGGYYPNAPYSNVGHQGWSAVEKQKVKGVKTGHYPAQENKGNVCAYAPSGPIKYNKLHIQHFPSDDYKVPHPKGWLHTIHSQQQLGQYVPYR